MHLLPIESKNCNKLKCVWHLKFLVEHGITLKSSQNLVDLIQRNRQLKEKVFSCQILDFKNQIALATENMTLHQYIQNNFSFSNLQGTKKCNFSRKESTSPGQRVEKLCDKLKILSLTVSKSVRVFDLSGLLI